MIRQESSRKRVTSELIKRLKNLTPAELAFLASTADSASVDAVIWVAICRTYEFIETFVTNVVAERWREGTTTLTEGVYEAFASEQAALHPKLAGLSGQTTARLRSQLFTIMREMRFLEKDGTLLPYLIPSAAKALLPDEDLSLFPTAVS